MRYRKLLSKINLKRLFLFPIFLFTSCFQDVIDIDLSTIDKQIVIEGIITDQNIPCRVIVSKPSNIYKESSVQYVSDALVSISDDLGNTETLEETEPGIYQTDQLHGVPGRTYELNVTVEGIRYFAISKMPSPIELDSINYERSNSNSSSYDLKLFFTDTEGVEEYSRINLYRNFYFLEDEYILYQDSYTDGEQVSIDDIGTNFFEFDRVRVVLLSIEKEIYDYYSVLYNILDEDPDDEQIIDLASANPKSNISNNALGYFSAHSVRSYTITIQ